MDEYANELRREGVVRNINFRLRRNCIVDLSTVSLYYGCHLSMVTVRTNSTKRMINNVMIE